MCVILSANDFYSQKKNAGGAVLTAVLEIVPRAGSGSKGVLSVPGGPGEDRPEREPPEHGGETGQGLRWLLGAQRLGSARRSDWRRDWGVVWKELDSLRCRCGGN